VKTALGRQADFSVVTCASGFEALIIVGQLRPDLVLMDVAMPRAPPKSSACLSIRQPFRR
jgi:CheY-like chemotaxis protein